MSSLLFGVMMHWIVFILILIGCSKSPASPDSQPISGLVPLPTAPFGRVALVGTREYAGSNVFICEGVVMRSRTIEVRSS